MKSKNSCMEQSGKRIVYECGGQKLKDIKGNSNNIERNFQAYTKGGWCSASRR